MEKDKNLSINIKRNKLVLIIVLLISVLIAARCYNVKDYIGEWEGTYINQYSDGTKGLIPGKQIFSYTVKINPIGYVDIHEYMGIFEQKDKNGLFTESYSFEYDLSGHLITKHGKIYLKVDKSDNGRAGLKKGDITELEWLNYNELKMILPDFEVNLKK